MQKAVFDEEHCNRRSARIWVVATIILGVAFVANQATEWLFLPTRPGTNAYGSLFFIMTGLHGLHVFLGLVAMIFLLGRMKGPPATRASSPSSRAVSYYWHFVDMVWIGLFSCLFLLK